MGRAIRCGEGEGTVVEAAHRVAALVHEAMMAPAERDEIPEARLTAVGPVSLFTTRTKCAL